MTDIVGIEHPQEKCFPVNIHIEFAFSVYGNNGLVSKLIFFFALIEIEGATDHWLGIYEMELF